jgi:oligoribonuclease
MSVTVFPTKLLWVDLEMTGLDPKSHRILEVVAKVTDFEFREIARYQAVIAQSEDVLLGSSEWVTEHHTTSGLFDRIREQGKPEPDVIHELSALIKQQFAAEPAILAGNSIHQDRRFIRQWWPEVDALLHYRMLDVTSFKIYAQGKYGLQFEKKEAHRALDDIDESIAELQYYLTWFASENDR